VRRGHELDEQPAQRRPGDHRRGVAGRERAVRLDEPPARHHRRQVGGRGQVGDDVQRAGQEGDRVQLSDRQGAERGRGRDARQHERAAEVGQHERRPPGQAVDQDADEQAEQEEGKGRHRLEHAHLDRTGAEHEHGREG
jgi:hypothetical protein